MVSAGFVCLVACTIALTPQCCWAAISDSVDDWSFTGTQGQDSWINGYYNYTTDPDGTYQTQDFISFLNDGTGVISPTNHWDGSAWRLPGDPGASGPPWTSLGQRAVHPNGTNSPPGEEHWVIRRWESTVSQPVRIVTYLDYTNPAGTGTTNMLFVNGSLLDSYTTSPDIPVTRYVDTTLNVGDIVDLALTPVGAGGARDDGGDGSVNRLTINPPIPAPGAILLGSIGVGFVGWLRRQKIL